MIVLGIILGLGLAFGLLCLVAWPVMLILGALGSGFWSCVLVVLLISFVYRSRK